VPLSAEIDREMRPYESRRFPDFANLAPKWFRKGILPNKNRTQAAEITPPAATEWSRLLLHDIICS